MKKYDLYLFDFDGTLINTMEALEFVFVVSYGHVGMTFDPKDTVDFSRISLTDGYARMKGKSENWKAFCKYIDISLDFPEALHRNHPYPETHEFLDYIRKNNIPCGIVTSNDSIHVQKVLDNFEVPDDTFSFIIGNKQCDAFKPHPDPILKALKRYNYKGPLDRVVYVGDGSNDMQCANNAGVDAILVDRIDAFEDSDKYTRIHNLMELFQ